MYEDWYGNEYEDEFVAREHAREEMDWPTYADYMQSSVSWQDLFNFARTHEDFYGRFAREIQIAEEEYFDHHYRLVED